VIDSDRIEGKKLALALKSRVGICYPMAQKTPHWWAEVTSGPWARCFLLEANPAHRWRYGSTE